MKQSTDERYESHCHPVLALLMLLAGFFLMASPAKGEGGDKGEPFPRIHQIQGSPDSARVNAWVVEGKSSLILVDTLLTTGDYAVLSKRLDSLGKPLKAVIITHPHPDHYNNLATLLKRHSKTATYGAPSVIEAIRRDDPAQRRFWTPFYPGTYPEELAVPTRPLPTEGSMTIDDMTIDFLTLEKGEASSQTILHIPAANAVITGDLVLNRVHPSFFGGNSAGWLAALDVLERRFPEARRILPGHGNAGGRELIATQREYLRRLRDEIRKQIDPDNDETPLSMKGFEEVNRKMLSEYPYDAGYNFGMIVRSVTDEIVSTMPKRTIEPFMY